ncbi:N-acylglucosamine-6-phosphate 2-epimerase [Paenibacillus curdlanolyticus YK9]|uniref:Putative N-acetylmannosamine-6-phosphate 2-epimerase n=1 Tax=Paenibacillus curdlanolyticus YK9 TaxID=717606 RepID=E0IEY6_9BACL|nr:N-acetylmannosamine-6-phosphate 2-epimerase [Paenibacillus curdlanolyticus]EFM08762.1 N-acylglucosamine-6-phosphate 2-epimerase [Paenibacillus curdlanolyticus YK9]
MLKEIVGGLVVSCQALPHEPLHSPSIMAKLALAAMQGGAVGIRANTLADIRAIKSEVSLPVIGIVKRDYEGSDVFITATMQEIDELLESGCEMIAMDATSRVRPGGVTTAELVDYCRRCSPSVELMADISTVEEAVAAAALGFDCVSTTLHGYTAGTSASKLYDNDFAFLKAVLSAVSIPVIAEGNVRTPDMLARCLTLGAASAVVGGAITRPLEITERFVAAIGSESA